MMPSTSWKEKRLPAVRELPPKVDLKVQAKQKVVVSAERLNSDLKLG